MSYDVDIQHRLYIDSEGELWMWSENELGGGWLWLREHYFESGWHWEGGYDKPVRPVKRVRLVTS